MRRPPTSSSKPSHADRFGGSRLRAPTAVLAAALALLAAGGSQALAQPCAPHPCTAFAVPSGATTTGDITLGPDGAMWFALSDRIGRATDGGAIQEFPLPAGVHAVGGITAGADGALWFTQDSPSAGPVGRMTVDGAYSAPAGSSDGGVDLPGGVELNGIVQLPPGLDIPLVTSEEEGITQGLASGGIAPAPDGTLWFATVDAIVALDPSSGAMAAFPLPYGRVTPGRGGVAVAPDGGVWFTTTRDHRLDTVERNNLPHVARVARLDPAGGAVHEFALPAAYSPRSQSVIQDIVLGPDGGMWFAATTGGLIGRIDSEGRVSTVDVPGYPLSITFGSGGVLYFVSQNGVDGSGWVGRMTMGGFYTLYDAHDSPLAAATAADGNIWWTQGQRVGRVDVFYGMRVDHAKARRITWSRTVYPRVFCPGGTLIFCRGWIRITRDTPDSSVQGPLLGVSRFAVRPKDGPSIRVALHPAVVRAILARGRLPVTVSATVRDGVGNERQDSARIFLYPPAGYRSYVQRLRLARAVRR